MNQGQVEKAVVSGLAVGGSFLLLHFAVGPLLNTVPAEAILSVGAGVVAWLFVSSREIAKALDAAKSAAQKVVGDVTSKK